MTSTSTVTAVKVEDSVAEATGAAITTQDHGYFTSVEVAQGRFSAAVFSGGGGEHRVVNLHMVVSVTVENGLYGPSFVIKHADGTDTRIYTYNA